MEESKYIWMDNNFVPWKEAKVHVLSHTLHYANAVFEGLRAYETKEGMAIFRLHEHTKRLYNSAKITCIKPNISYDDLIQAQIDIVKKNDLRGNVYIRPLIYLGYGVMGVYHVKAPVQTMVAAWNWGAYLGDDGLEKGIKVKISSYARNSVKSMMTKAKSAANYLNSQMAKYEAIECGYDEALLLDEDGFVAEGSGECFFIVRDGVIITPPHDNSLESITQDSVIQIAKYLDYEVEVRKISRDEAFIADEAFFTGTAAEVTPINNIDGRIIGSGSRGEVTKVLQKAYFEAATGREQEFEKWLTYIN